MFYDAKKAQDFASKLLEEGIYVIGFSTLLYPEGMLELGYKFLQRILKIKSSRLYRLL
jgi:hypothetical protein